MKLSNKKKQISKELKGNSDPIDKEIENLFMKVLLSILK